MYTYLWKREVGSSIVISKCGKYVAIHKCNKGGVPIYSIYDVNDQKRSMRTVLSIGALPDYRNW
jgi:hypothetical protein